MKNGRLGAATNVITIAVAAFLLFGPQGPILRWLADRKATRAMELLVRTQFEQVNAGSRLGRQAGPVDLVLFSDYECPFCQIQDSIMQAMIQTDHNLSIAFRHFPLPSHAAAPAAARLAACAGAEGHFAEAHRSLFLTPSWKADVAKLQEVVEHLDIPNKAIVQTCIDEMKSEVSVQSDLELGRMLGVHATPTWLYRTGVSAGLLSADSLRSLIAISRRSEGT